VGSVRHGVGGAGIGHTPSYMYSSSLLITPPPDVVIQSCVCMHYDLEHFMHVTQCVFSKLMQDEDGNTPLIEVCRWGHIKTARVLLDQGANVDLQNNVSSRIL
jgi:hypothetical protein